MNKPVWKDAPEWANYHTVDSSGACRWHEKKPIELVDSGCWIASGRFSFYRMIDHSVTLEARP
jgi:hypothetical protein